MFALRVKAHALLATAWLHVTLVYLDTTSQEIVALSAILHASAAMVLPIATASRAMVVPIWLEDFAVAVQQFATSASMEINAKVVQMDIFFIMATVYRPVLLSHTVWILLVSSVTNHVRPAIRLTVLLAIVAIFTSFKTSAIQVAPWTILQVATSASQQVSALIQIIGQTIVQPHKPKQDQSLTRLL